MDARQSRRGKRISLQQEKRAAADLGGRVQAASGAARLGGGGDVRVMSKTRVECKFTEKEDYILKIGELDKLKKQAIGALEYPVLQFAFRPPSGRLEQYAVIPWDEPEPPMTEWATSAKGLMMDRNLTRMAVAAGKVRVVFHVPGTLSLQSRYFRVMSWDDFVERQNA